MFSLNWTDLDNEDIDGKDTSELQLINIEWKTEWKKKSPTGNHKKIVSSKDHQWIPEGAWECEEKKTFAWSQSISLALIAKGKIVTS